MGELTSQMFSNLAGTNLIAYGVIIIIIILFMPEGVVGRYHDWVNRRKKGNKETQEQKESVTS